MRNERGSPRAKATPTTTQPPDGGLYIISPRRDINQPIRPDEALPPVCETDPTRCGSFLSSDGPCPRYSRRGCPLRHQAGYKCVTGREDRGAEEVQA